MNDPRAVRAPDFAAVDSPYGDVTAVEEVLLGSAKRLAASVPTPAHDPWYGLDRLRGPSLRVLERLTRHGDFRKYVHVLDAGAGLGAGARWLALRYGCRVVALDASRAMVAVGRRLTRRARLADRVRGLVGDFEAIPVRGGTFTQIWSVEALHHARDRRDAIAELFRVLRPGSTLALQEVVRRDASVPVFGGPWRHGTADDYHEALAAAGFIGIEREDVTAERPERSPLVLSAWAQLERLLAARARPVAVERDATALIAGPDYRVLHFFARRPSL